MAKKMWKSPGPMKLERLTRDSKILEVNPSINALVIDLNVQIISDML